MEQRFQNSEEKCLPQNSIVNKTTNLLRGLDKGIFRHAKTQKPYLLRKNTYLRKPLEDILPQNVREKLKKREKEREQEREKEEERKRGREGGREGGREEENMRSPQQGIRFRRVTQAFTAQWHRPQGAATPEYSKSAAYTDGWL